MRNFATREEAFQAMIKEGVAHEAVSIGDPQDGVTYTHDSTHPESIAAAARWPRG